MKKEEGILKLTDVQKGLIELIKITKITGYTIEITSNESIKIELW